MARAALAKTEEMKLPPFLDRRNKPQPPEPSPQLMAVLRLTKEEAIRVWHRCHQRDITFPTFQSGENESDTGAAAKGLLLSAVRHGKAQADLVMSVMRDRDAMTDSIAQTLTGKAIQRLPEKGAHAPRFSKPTKIRPSQTFQGDTDVIHLVKEGNPRKPGTRAALLYALYKDGMTVAEYVAAGGGRGNVKCDLERGNISLEPATKKGK